MTHSNSQPPLPPLAIVDAPTNHGLPARRLALIADDEAPIRMVVGEKLRSSGFEVVEAADGEEAFELAKQRRPDIIVTDLQMPYMSGLDFARQVSENASTAGVPMILLTARGHILLPDALKSVSIRRVMAKPFSAKELVSVINEVLLKEGSLAAGGPAAKVA